MKKKKKSRNFSRDAIPRPKSGTSAGKWYVVHTYSGHEKRVGDALAQRVKTMGLESRVFETLIPTQNKIKITRGKKETIKERMFPGYVLVRMILDDDSWLVVRTTQGVTGFVGAGKKPTPLPPDEVKAVKKFMQLKAPRYKAAFSVGEAVKIIEGPFTDFLGTVESIDEERGKARVSVTVFGRETPIELDLLQVGKI